MVKLAATVGMGNNLSSVSAPLLPSPLGFNPIRRCFCVVKSSLLIPARIQGRLFTPKVRASSATVVETKPDPVIDETKLNIRKNILACPICYEPVIWNGDHVLSLESVAQCTLQCHSCKKSYYGKDSHLDLTVTGGGKVYGESMPASTELFRFPLVSFLYERGWRQSFSIWGGFPGLEKEFELAKNYLKPVLGGNIIDASCGSGLFSRIFAKSGLFSLVFALDFSESMLQQCYDFIKQEDNFPQENLILVRADISRLPFASGSIDAVHAGAALHCWPSPSAAVAEISRVLKPGGMFVATTYILDGPFSYIPLRRPVRQTVAQISGSHVFLSEKELEDLCTSCGLVNFTWTRNRAFVMIAAMKPVQ
ncbi:Demethylmenaquinone methyltransferase [Handroanthus impetiginosus]|uniref:Demethylmenaquinone methyltransferase n=1 Tax=Handroanthus impetiginosus TaxID=429701 RepID=A0A2G9G2I4_9LAMI|nr:Demethylmenaquinone methyltransferase [Handroanthus impetiginosus]